MKQQAWVIEDHLCRHCGGRILRCVRGNGVTGGGNPIFKCADCGRSTAAMGPQCLCWCDFKHRNNHHMHAGYMCVPYTVLKEHPELERGFWACGCDPKVGEVGIMLVRDYYDLQKKAEEAKNAGRG